MFALLLQLASGLYYFTLHVTGAGLFPPPLSAKKETLLLQISRDGDREVCNRPIEHNLRLVAHIVKKSYSTVY